MVFTKDFSQLLLIPESMEGAVTLPDSTVAVPALAFSHSAKLTAVQVGGDSASFSSIDGVLYSKDGKTLLLYPRAKGEAVVIPEGVTAIGPDAFAGNTELSSLVVLGHVTSIDKQAFHSSVVDAATVALPLSDDYAARKAVWEEIGFTSFTEPAKPGDIEKPMSHDSGFAYTLLPDYTLEVSWAGEKQPDGDLVIPSSATVGTTSYRVSAIAGSAFENKETVKSVAIPSSVQTIGSSAFAGCLSLETASFEEGLASLQDSAFERTALEEVFLPTSVSEIGGRVFAQCTSLVRIVSLTESISVADSALEGCTDTSILVPYREDGVYAWNLGIPSSNNHLEPYGIAIPEQSLTLEGGQSKSLFENGALFVPADAEVVYSYPATSVSVDQDGVVASKATGQTTVNARICLGEKVLCSKSREVSATEVVTDDASNPGDLDGSIARDALPTQMPFTAINLSLRSAGISEGVVDLLSAQGVGESVTLDGLVYTVRTDGNASVRMENTSITKADIQPVVTIAGASRSVVEIEALAFAGSSIASVSIPSSVTSIGETAFKGCENLTSLFIPASVAFLGKGVFLLSNNITSIAVEEGSRYFTVINGVVYMLDENGNSIRCIGGSPSSVAGTVVIPATTRSIADRAFFACGSVTEIILPEGLVSIEPCAFQSTSISSLVIPSSVSAISNENIYVQCFSLSSVSVAQGNAKYRAIDNNLYEIDSDGNPSILLAGYPSQSGLFSLPETVIGISQFAFFACSGLRGITLPASVMWAEYSVFAYSSVTEITCYSSRFDPRAAGFENIEKKNLAINLPEGGTINGISADQIKSMWLEAGFTDFATAPLKVVSFESNGGSSLFPITGASGFTPTKPDDPTQLGNAFTGWYTDAALKNQYAFTTPIATNTTLYAGWLSGGHTVTFDANGGTPALSTKAVPHDAVVAQPGNPMLEGYDFLGWYTEQTNGTKWNFNTAVTVDMTLWAHWKLKTYTAMFHPNNGGTDTKKDVDHGNKVSPLAVSKSGYSFIAWCLDSSLTQPYNFDTPVISNLELWAQWAGMPYVITFDANEGTGTMAPQPTNYGAKTSLSANAFVREGYTFTGWNTEKLGVGTAFANKEEVLDLPVNGANAITLYAQWTENKYSIEFVPNPPSGLSVVGDMATMSNIAYGNSVALTSNGFTCSGGFVFDHWTLDRQGIGIPYANGATVSKLGGKTQNNEIVRLYAQWKGSPYTVSYNKTYADVTGTMPDETFAYGGWYTLTDNAFFRSGYTFSGWAKSESDAQNGIVAYLDGDSVKDLPTNAGPSVTLYAVWAKQLTVTSPVNPVITIDAQGKPTADTSTYFESSTEAPVEIVSVTCSTVVGPDGTERVFPDVSQWGNIVVTLGAKGTTKNLFLNDESAIRLGLTIPAKTDVDNAKLPVTFGMKFVEAVDIEYSKDQQTAIASLVFSFKVA